MASKIWNTYFFFSNTLNFGVLIAFKTEFLKCNMLLRSQPHNKSLGTFFLTLDDSLVNIFHTWLYPIILCIMLQQGTQTRSNMNTLNQFVSQAYQCITNFLNTIFPLKCFWLFFDFNLILSIKFISEAGKFPIFLDGEDK